MNIKYYIDQKMCFVCQEPLYKSSFQGVYDHYHCAPHMKAMYDKENFKFLFLRIKNPDSSFKLEYSVRGEHIFISGKINSALISIPNFDITQYSYLELEKKIKTYIIFS